MSTPTESKGAGHNRSLGLPDVVALGINGVIGQGIFLLPGLAAALMGPASLTALALAGFLSCLIALCFAEVASHFDKTGGAYVYAREAFGDFVGFEVGWLTCCVAVISWAALANGFTEVLAHFVPAVREPTLQKVVAIGLMTALMGLNLFGARIGASISTFFSVAKLIPLILFIVVGAFYLQGALFDPFAPKGYGSIADATLVLLYVYVGFETLVVPAGEMKNPQKNVPIALMAVMVIVTVVYMAVLTVSVGTLPELAGHANPVAAASTNVLGAVGGTIVAAGICVSVFGTNAGAALVSPRRFYALAERGDLPKIFALVDPKSGSPRPAIVLTWALAVILALTGSFKELAVLGVVARFLQYIPTCLAALVFRRRYKDQPRQGFTLPFGPVIPLATIGLCVWLLAASYEKNPERLHYGLLAVAIGVPLYFVAQWNRRREAEG